MSFSVLPEGANGFHSVTNEREQPSATYRLDLDKGRIVGYVDGEEAVQQAIRKAILTERFKNTIYDNQYGSELSLLLGEGTVQRPYIESEVQRCIRDALSIDSRILTLEEFQFSYHDAAVYVSFTAVTIFGKSHIDDMEVLRNV